MRPAFFASEGRGRAEALTPSTTSLSYRQAWCVCVKHNHRRGPHGPLRALSNLMQDCATVFIGIL